MLGISNHQLVKSTNSLLKNTSEFAAKKAEHIHYQAATVLPSGALDIAVAIANHDYKMLFVFGAQKLLFDGCELIKMRMDKTLSSLSHKTECFNSLAYVKDGFKALGKGISNLVVKSK